MTLLMRMPQVVSFCFQSKILKGSFDAIINYNNINPKSRQSRKYRVLQNLYRFRPLVRINSHHFPYNISNTIHKILILMLALQHLPKIDPRQPHQHPILHNFLLIPTKVYYLPACGLITGVWHQHLGLR